MTIARIIFIIGLVIAIITIILQGAEGCQKVPSPINIKTRDFNRDSRYFSFEFELDPIVFPVGKQYDQIDVDITCKGVTFTGKHVEIITIAIVQTDDGRELMHTFRLTRKLNGNRIKINELEWPTLSSAHTPIRRMVVRGEISNISKAGIAITPTQVVATTNREATQTGSEQIFFPNPIFASMKFMSSKYRADETPVGKSHFKKFKIQLNHIKLSSANITSVVLKDDFGLVVFDTTPWTFPNRSIINHPTPFNSWGSKRVSTTAQATCQANDIDFIATISADGSLEIPPEIFRTDTIRIECEPETVMINYGEFDWDREPVLTLVAIDSNGKHHSVDVLIRGWNRFALISFMTLILVAAILVAVMLTKCFKKRCHRNTPLTTEPLLINQFSDENFVAIA